MVGKLATDAVKRRDLDQAMRTWRDYMMRRFFRVTVTSTGVLVEMVQPPVPPGMLRDLEHQWIEGFMTLRGWRQLPGVVSLTGLAEWV